MSKYFNKFLHLNKKIIKNYNNSNGHVLLVDRGRYLSAIKSSIMTSAINKKHKVNALVITDYDDNSNIVNLYKSFGFKNFHLGFRYKLILKKFFIFIKAIYLLIKSIIVIKKKDFFWFINNFKVENIKIGDLIYDTYIRNYHKFINPKIDIIFVNILFKSIFRILNILSFVEKYPIKFIVIGTSTYSHNGGIALRIGLEKNIKVLEPYSNPIKKNSESLNQVEIYSKSKVKYGFFNLFIQGYKKKILGQKINTKVMNVFIKKRFQGKLRSSYTSRPDLNIMKKMYFKNQKFLNKEKLLNHFRMDNNKIKKIVLIAPHAFSDAPHGHAGFFVFRDYYDQLRQTLEFIDKQKFNNILYLVRPHPASIMFKEFGIVEKLINKIDNKFIRLSPKYINISNLINICDCVVTGRGTIGMEFACAGKYPIIAGSGVYSGLGFSLESKNKKQYFSRLLNIDKISKLNKKQILTAKKTLYYLEAAKTYSGGDKIMDEKVLKNAFKNDNSLFCEELIKNLKKTDFDKGTFYQNLFKYV